jgi:uncharacterized membrane protein HdeD (DUF308 family)
LGQTRAHGVFIAIAGAAIIGLAELIAGVTLALIIYLVGFILLISGVYSLIKSLHLRSSVGVDWSRLFIGALKIFFALVLFTQTKATATILVWFIGLFLLLLGAGLIFAAFRLRKMSGYIAPAMKNDVVEARLVGDEVVVDGDPVDAPPEDLKELPDHVE